ncbi:MAG: 50S ribosomal protein L18 [Candidatus Binatia bacterium]|nr:MAG: 50S ribosomal protein L18 [Candidatus Binatia bacterium]
MALAKKVLARYRRQARVRKKVRGTDTKPRLCVFRSNKHIYVQVISDQTGRTLAAASTLAPELAELGKTGNKEAAFKVGELIGQKCKGLGITEVVFDRNGFLYHGRVQAVAEGARQAGLKF